MAKPVYDPTQIENQLYTSWGGADEGIVRSWDTLALTVYLGTDPTSQVAGANGEGASYVPMTSNEVRYAEAAFDEWSQLSDLTFNYTSDPNSNITLSYSSNTKKDGTYATSSLSSGDSQIDHEDIWLSADAAKWPDQQDASISFVNYGFVTMLHEIGHTLGLSHPGPYDAGDSGASLTYDANAVFAQDNRQYTIMSYFGYETDSDTGWTQDGTSNGNLTAGSLVIYPSTPMLYDIKAIQDKYGANTSTRAGDTTYGFHSTAGEDYYDFSEYPKVVFTIWDGGGHDTLDASFSDHPTQRIDLHAGAYSDVGGLINNIAIAFGVTIEDAIGGNGDDSILGNQADNHLIGGDGNDFLDGGGSLDGGDVLTGGLGDDTFFYVSGYRATVITDFSQNVDGNSDTLDLTNTSVHSFTDLLADASQQGADTIFNFGHGDTLKLQNFALDTLIPDRMRFSEPTEGAPGDFLLAANPGAGTGGAYFTYTASLSNGGFAAVILDNPTLLLTSPIVAQVYDSRGVAIAGDTFAINSTPLGAFENNDLGLNFHLASLPGDKFVAVWDADALDQSPGSAEPFREIRARVFNADGTPLGSDFVVNETPPVVQGNGFNYFRTADLQTTPAGGFIVRWLTDVTPDNTSRQVHLYQRGFDSDGIAVGGDVDLGPAIPPVFQPPQVSDVFTYELSDGGLLQYWQVYDRGNLTTGAGTFAHAYAQILGHTGVVQLDQDGYIPATGSQGPPDIRVSELDDHRILFTWSTGGYHETGGLAIGTYAGSQSLILNSDLQGFTRPGTSGDDVLKGSIYGDRLYGLDGNDTLIGNAGPDLLDGGPGNDTVDYTDSLQGVDVDLTRTGPQAGGHAEGDVLVSIENITGSNYGDNLAGDEGANIINGGYGDDYIFGAGGADQLHGGPGNDHVSLQGDGGTAWGDAGDDVFTIRAGSGNTLNGGAGADELDVTGNNNFLNGDAGDDKFDVIDGSGNSLSGGDGDDILYLEGSGSGNSLYGGAGDDILNAVNNTGAGNSFYGGDGNDFLNGGHGNDLLVGGAGNDKIVGGDGIDTAQFSSSVSDYSITYDPKELSLTITDLRPGSPDGTDSVANDVEKLTFGNITYDAAFFHSAAKAADGYIVGATVFGDANNNGKLDTGEVSATTDSTGGFALTGASGPLILSGGTDVGTGLAFGGKMLAPAGYNYVTPLSTIVQWLTQDGAANPLQTTLANLGLDSTTDLANTDPIVDFISAASFGRPEAVDVQIANTVDLIASAIEGANPGQFGSAYDDVFHALASAIGGGFFDFTATSAITNVIDATLSAGSFTLDPGVVGGVAEIIAAVNAQAEELFGDAHGLAYLQTLAKVAQGDAADAVRQAGADPAKISDAVSNFTDTALNHAITQQFGHTGDIDGPFINNAPIPAADSYTAAADGLLIVDAVNGVLANDIDYDSDKLTAVLDGGPFNGTLTLNADGSFTYQPNAGFTGFDNFTYAADDGTSQTTQTVSIKVAETPQPVVADITASPDSGTLHGGDTITFSVTMSSAVTVIGPLQLDLNDNGTADYQSGSGTDTLIFTSTVVDGEHAAPLAILGDDTDGATVFVIDALTGAAADLSGADVTFADVSVACYCPGTLIATERGEVAVEDLSIGDRVVTKSAPRPIKWLGRRSYGGRFAYGQKDILPICFKAGSLGDNIPRRDLWISPHHAMYLQGVLIEAKDLVNGVSIIQVQEIDRVDYIHIELDSHDLILAEGAWSETFVDDDSRGMFHNSHEYRALYPDAPVVPARYCAPRLDTGYAVEAARRGIDTRAGLRPAGGERTPPLRGYVDAIGRHHIAGWAQNSEHPEAPVCLDIRAGGQLIGRVLANRYREDLERAGLGSGRHGFEFRLPEFYLSKGLALAPDAIKVHRSFDGATLAVSARAA